MIQGREKKFRALAFGELLRYDLRDLLNVHNSTPRVASRLRRAAQPNTKVLNLLFVGIVLFVVGSGTVSWSAGNADRSSRSSASSGELETVIFEKFLPLHQFKKAPGPYDWLAQHEEEGQTFAQYVASQPAVPGDQQKFIYITLLGDFDAPRREILNQTAEFIAAYFGLTVKWIASVPLSAIPPLARRVHPQTGDEQILTTYVIEEVLKPARPKDAFCLIAFTSSDLWPGEGWNFVFGQASAEDRIGVWSIYRNGNPNAGVEEKQLCLKRTIKTATHEIGHMFGLAHCIFFECNMNGSNYRKEADARPLWLCPVCLRKLQWALKFDLVARYERLAELCGRLGWKEEEQFYRASIKAIKGEENE